MVCIVHRAEYAPSDYHGELRRAQRAKWSLDRYKSVCYYVSHKKDEEIAHSSTEHFMNNNCQGYYFDPRLQCSSWSGGLQGRGGEEGTQDA